MLLISRPIPTHLPTGLILMKLPSSAIGKTITSFEKFCLCLKFFVTVQHLLKEYIINKDFILHDVLSYLNSNSLHKWHVAHKLNDLF